MDAEFFLAINRLGTPGLDGVMSVITEAGRGDFLVFLAALAVIAATRQVRFLALGSLVAAALLAGLATEQVKDMVQRPRPLSALGDQVRVVGDELRQRSFPSGHSSSAAAIAVVAARRIRRRRAWVAAAVVPLVVGFSRVYVGAHFPGDVLAGLVLGALCGEVVHRVTFRLEAAWARWRARHIVNPGAKESP